MRSFNPRRGAYNKDMARGWESKSIEAQIDEAEFPSKAPFQKTHPLP